MSFVPGRLFTKAFREIIMKEVSVRKSAPFGALPTSLFYLYEEKCRCYVRQPESYLSIWGFGLDDKKVYIKSKGGNWNGRE